MANEKRDRVVAARIDNLTEDESNKVADEIKEIKRKHAPQGRGTIIQSTVGKLKDAYRKLIGDDSDDQK